MEVAAGAGGDRTFSEGSVRVSWQEGGPLEMGGPGLTLGGGTAGWGLG